MVEDVVATAAPSADNRLRIEHLFGTITFMVATELEARRVMARLKAAVDALDQLDLDAIAPSTASTVLVELSTQSDRLRGEIARVAAVVADSEAWRASGAASMAAFFSNATGVAWGQARATVELGEVMAQHEAIDHAVRCGDLSPAAALQLAAAVDDVGFDAVEGELVDELAGLTPTKAAQTVEAWRAVANPVDDAARRTTANAARCLSFRPAGDGMTHVDGVLPNRIAQSLRRTLSHLAEQQRTDNSGRSATQRRVDALGDLCSAYERGEVTGGRNLPRVIATMTLADLERRSGVATGTFGETLTADEVDEICCDAVIHRYVADQTGATINFGRGRRTISPQQFLALVARDGGCRHPGCDRPPEWCEGHHINEFAARGGLTNLDELVLLCHHHHHDVHDRSWELTGTAQHLIFIGPDGRRLPSSLDTVHRQVA